MSKRIPEGTKQLMQELFDDGLPVAEIARRTNVSYLAAYAHTRLKQRENPETGQPFESQSEYMDYLIRQRENPETEKPFESMSQYWEYIARQRENPETGKPFESMSQYKGHAERRRAEKAENQGLGSLITRRLEEIGENQSWLARQIDVSREAVSKYAQGKYIPKDEILGKLFLALEVPYETLDDLVV